MIGLTLITIPEQQKIDQTIKKYSFHTHRVCWYKNAQIQEPIDLCSNKFKTLKIWYQSQQQTNPISKIQEPINLSNNKNQNLVTKYDTNNKKKKKKTDTISKNQYSNQRIIDQPF